MKTSMENRDWPVLKRYDADHLARIALPLGGIGTGTVSLGGRGDLRDWEVVNRPAKGFVPQTAFFALFAKPAGGPTVSRLLEGPLDLSLYEGGSGSTAPNHGLPRFRHASFAAAYPFGQVLLNDPDMPVNVRIEGFNPLIPANADASGIPVAVLRYVLTNRTGKRVSASVCGSLQNFIGNDGLVTSAQANRNEFRSEGRMRGIFMHSTGVDKNAAQWGTMSLATSSPGRISYRTAWLASGWGTIGLDFWDDFSGDGKVEEREIGNCNTPVASLCVAVDLPPRSTRTVSFLIAWHFPNRYTWTPDDSGCCSESNRIGNYYATQYRDAWDVAVKTAAKLPALERDTARFVGAFCRSSLPAEVREAALFNLAHLRTQTCFRTPDGRFYGWEGCNDHDGCCHGSCTHVWNYEQAVAFLFGDIAGVMREVEFGQATGDDGLMSFRVTLPVRRAGEWKKAAADGHLGCIMKMYRDWQLSGDDKFLKTLWPKVRKSVEFCWSKGGWDADRDGVMEGCQHNTMDVEYYGPNGQMGSWYLGALRAAEEMARYVGDSKFADTCRKLFENGSRWMDENLFNGEYYEQEIRPPASGSAVQEGLRVGAAVADGTVPDYQLGAACLVDQLVGQYMAHICGLGYLLKPENVRKTLQSIMKYNLRNGVYGHFNCLRSFVLGDESALLMAAYPKDRPRIPFPYFTEVMTGFEYTAAVGMLYEGQTKNGLICIRNIRDRYDGRKRSPFNEAECGHHYARSMASWAAVLALTGFQYSGVEKSLTLKAASGTFFWSNGRAWGVCVLKKKKNFFDVELSALYGNLPLSRFILDKYGHRDFDGQQPVKAGRTLRFRVARG